MCSLPCLPVRCDPIKLRKTVVLKGNKRYILTPPRTCKQLKIIDDQKHPSYRHSVIDWSDIAQAESTGFDSIDAINTVVRTGEVL